MEFEISNTPRNKGAKIGKTIEKMDYLTAREQFKICLAKWTNQGRYLQQLLGADDDGPALEDAILKARQSRKFADAISEYGRLGALLDEASDQWDAAQEQQAKQTIKAQATLNRDLKLLDC